MNALTYETRFPLEQISLKPLSEPSPAAELAVNDEFVHPGAIGLAMGGFVLFIVASWAGWSFGYTTLLLAVVTGLAAMYFGLMIGLGRNAAKFRGDVGTRSFRAFLNGYVQVLTGRVSGRDALVQIAFMPILLGVTMGFFAIYWLRVRG